MEEGTVRYQKAGTPQGGVISPLLSNIYLHEVLDGWFVETVQPLLKGKSFMARYADDAIIGCEREEDADRIMKVLALRFAKYGLTIHPEKTRLVDFRKPEGDSRNHPLLDEVAEGALDGRQENRPETVCPEFERDSSLVPGTPATKQTRTAQGAVAETPGTLCLLRNIAQF
ncbi:reverse transcriptase domain-containing protein [Treponema sp. TIM-1]|uniref:reverse transcriptase domain-containing protein n=1 Tax=Treponema sp. TIM-1 TaxID=2898417 RepID=UPI00397F2A70